VKNNVDFSDVRELSLLLARFASVTGTAGEKEFAPFLIELLSGMPWFGTHPDGLRLLPIPGDPNGRSNVAAFVRGSGSRCLVLTGHYDVVETTGYGPLESLAFEPEALAARILETVPEDGADPVSARLRADIASGEFLPGRGILDMKSGIAAGIATLFRFAKFGEKIGNMLLLAVADEEGGSCGMRAASPALRDYLAELGCEPSAVFNLDSAVDQGAGEAGRVIFLGSVGKLLPFVLFIGKSAHAGAPFDGINPALLAAEFVRSVESNPEALGEKPQASGESPPPPPVLLYMREMRSSYDVTTPKSVFCAMNALSHERGPDEVLACTAGLAAAAMDKSLSILRERASEQSRRGSERFSPPDRQPVTMDFAELVARAEAMVPGILEAARIKADDARAVDPVAAACAVVSALAAIAIPEGPCAVVGFAPPYYPCARLDKLRDTVFLATLRRETARFAVDTGTQVRLRQYFPGISDMSFMAASDGPGLADFVDARSPLRSASAPPALGCPVINVGPWGRDYHQAGERVHVRYSFVELPELLWRLAMGVLEPCGEA